MREQSEFRLKLFLSPMIFCSVFYSTFFSTAEAHIFDGALPAPSSLHPLLSEEKPFVVEIGFAYLHAALPPIENIVVENARTSTVSGVNYGTVNNNYSDVFGQTLKVQALLNASKHWTVGLKTFLPLNSLAEMDTGNIYQPEYVLYRTESQRPRILLTSGIDLGSDWRVGIGADVGFSVTAQANVFLQSGSGTYSDQRISAKVKPSLVPQASIQYQNYTFAVRGENKAGFDLTTVAAARVFGSANAAVNFAYDTNSALYFDPWDFELSGKNQLNETWAVVWGVAYQLWGGYQAGAAVIEQNVTNQCNGNGGCSSSFSASQPPGFKARNLIVPEAGFELSLGGNRYDLAYRFKDSIFNGVPTGAGNYLDPPRHDILLGATFPTKGGWEWNVQAQISRLASQTVVKTDPTEIGATSPVSSGYTASGWLYGGNFALTIPFRAD